MFNKNMQNLIVDFLSKSNKEDLLKKMEKITNSQEFKSLANDLNLNLKEIFDKKETKEEPNQNSSKQPNIDHAALLSSYQKKLFKTFIHKRKNTEYLLVDIVNVLTTDHDKFPMMAVYHDTQNQTKWCRPLVEFYTNFTEKA